MTDILSLLTDPEVSGVRGGERADRTSEGDRV
jgi:hypothetical protein